MVKMKDRNAQLRQSIGSITTKERIIESNSVPTPDTVNRQGYEAYSLSDELRLLSMLNTLKLEPQFYRSETQTMSELRDLIERIGMKDPYFLCQAIVYSRCIGEGMRSINHLAATLAAPFISGKPFAKAFYSLFNKKTKSGGCVYRVDDMKEMKDVWAILNSYNKNGEQKMLGLPNAMKKGFASVLESIDTYQMAKYKKTVIDIANLVHPNAKRSIAETVIDDKKVKTLNALMNGIVVSADTWEVANSDAGQEVAKAIKQGKLTKHEAKIVLEKAKNDNWESLLNDGKLGILAALRNIRSMMQSPRKEVITKLCELVSDEKKLRDGLVMPYQIDYAFETLKSEFSNDTYFSNISVALQKGYEKSVPNLANALHGNTLIMLDCSGSMRSFCTFNSSSKSTKSRAIDKAALLAATIAKATGADILRFGTSAEMYHYRKTTNVFALAKNLANPDMGGTSIAAAFRYINDRKLRYDRIIILSDNECNTNSKHSFWGTDFTTSAEYKNYIKNVCSPYIYCVDLCAYGTTPLRNEGKVNYYFGYGFALFDDISSNEFNPNIHIDKVRKVVVDPNYNTEDE